MDNIQFLIKFGERTYMERFASGYLYFSHALKFREYENTLKIKGQGDRLEGGSKIFAQKFTMQSHDEPSKVGTASRANVTVTYEPANNIPVLCLFSCFDKDCMAVSANAYKITLDDKVKEDISSHFEKADTAVIIHNPAAFASDVHSAFSGACKTELVNYFHIEGFPMDDGGYSMDLQYFKYLSQDTPPQKAGKGLQYSFNADYVYRALFCKDVFFTNEQEYRVLLPEQSISAPKEYYVEYKNTKSSIVPLDDLFNNKVTISR
ncbi:hypothetical protein GX865_06135 [Candidatus Saccharibacteria bacterium]|uniref:Uncharacterized protein n=1 Tax=Dehalobacterium formicoaceticum TaxID=51515 RepID=A0ABT1Y853_9FIRM|nr:hypothetical protein [Dehalobacterium formicoaceticum]MCR6547064.1 hypothetical protein [Dehalobacterium formicoaceticum]NLA43689.1 hypothetical protein [Candidatus Saccharibacteria bacterium]